MVSDAATPCGSCGMALALGLALSSLASVCLRRQCLRLLASNGSCKVRIDLVRFTAIKDTNAKKFLFECGTAYETSEQQQREDAVTETETRAGAANQRIRLGVAINQVITPPAKAARASFPANCGRC